MSGWRARRPARRRGRGGPVEAESLAFHRRIREAFRALADAEPQRCVLVDATGSVDAVAAAVWRVVRRPAAGCGQGATGMSKDILADQCRIFPIRARLPHSSAIRRRRRSFSMPTAAGGCTMPGSSAGRRASARPRWAYRIAKFCSRFRARTGGAGHRPVRAGGPYGVCPCSGAGPCGPAGAAPDPRQIRQEHQAPIFHLMMCGGDRPVLADIGEGGWAFASSMRRTI